LGDVNNFLLQKNYARIITIKKIRKLGMNEVLKGEKAAKFVSWLACVKGFLPNSMTIEEASEIFLRRCADEEEAKKNEKKNG
jgi:hypothetical protein